MATTAPSPFCSAKVITRLARPASTLPVMRQAPASATAVSANGRPAAAATTRTPPRDTPSMTSAPSVFQDSERGARAGTTGASSSGCSSKPGGGATSTVAVCADPSSEPGTAAAPATTFVSALSSGDCRSSGISVSLCGSSATSGCSSSVSPTLMASVRLAISVSPDALFDPTDTRCSPGPSARSDTTTHSPSSLAVVLPRMISPSNTVTSAKGAALPANTASPSGVTCARSISTAVAWSEAASAADGFAASSCADPSDVSAGACLSAAVPPACGTAAVTCWPLSACGSTASCPPSSSRTTASATTAMAAPTPTRMYVSNRTGNHLFTG